MKRSCLRPVRTTHQGRPVRRTSYGRTQPESPYKGRVRIGKPRVDLGRYHRKAEARAAEKSARRVKSYRTPQRSRIPDPERDVSRETFRRTGSQRKTSLAHGMARATVQAILREAPHDHPGAMLLVV